MTLTQPAVYQDRHILISYTRHEVYAGLQRVELTPMEWQMLDLFVQAPRQILCWSWIVCALYRNRRYQPCDQRNIKYHIWKLRRKLGWEVGGGPLQTVRGFGYRYDPEWPAETE